MAVKLLVGKTGSGKTQHIYDALISNSLSDDHKDHHIIIVPEQASLDVQHELVSKHPRHSITNIEILSFARLAYRLSDDLEIAGQTVLSDIGKNMMIRSIVSSSKESFPFLNQHMHKKGYVNECRSLLTEFSRYTIDEPALNKTIEVLNQSLLKIKLKDSKELYLKYQEKIKDHYLSGETVMERLVNQCQKSDMLKKVNLYIDGFYGFTPIQYALIFKLMAICKNVSIAITVNPDILTKVSIEEHHLYYESHLTYKKLISGLEAYPDIEVDTIKFQMLREQPVRNALVESLYQYPYKVYNQDAKGLLINQCSSTSQEIKYVRDSIHKLVRQGDYRYKDIAILSGDLSNHYQIINEAFTESTIPYYLDQKKLMATNEAVSFLMAILKIYKNNLDAKSMFEYLKSDFVDMDQTLLDYVENYVIRYGIRGWKKWTNEWVYKVPDIYAGATDDACVNRLETLNMARQTIVQIFLDHKIRGKATVKEHVQRLYDLMLAHNLEDKLTQKADRFTENLAFEKAREYNQIYKSMIELLDQMVGISNEELLDIQAFYDLLQAGIEQLELGLVPANVDQVIIGDLARTRLKYKKCLFVIGVNEGVVPRLQDGTGLISDQERKILSDKGLSLAPTAMSNLFRDQFYVYVAMLRYTDKLYLSYTTSNDEGKATRPSHLIHMIKKIIPNCRQLDIDRLYEQKPIAYTEGVLYKDYISHLQQSIEGHQTIKSFLTASKTYNNRLKFALNGREKHEKLRPLEALSSDLLFGNTLANSVTRLEQFAACPFAHFMTYGLKANEREKYEITMPQLGMIFHKVIELFSKRVQQRNVDWKDINDDLRVSWVNELVEYVIGEEQYAVFFDNSRNAYRLDRLSQMLNKALWAIGYQVSKGIFRPSDSEWRFDGKEHNLSTLNIELGDRKTMALRGTIDRIDQARVGDCHYLTIVDYKSSSHDFDLNKVYEGLQLQLLVYLNAACEVKSNDRNEVEPAGMFYFKIDDPYISGPRRLEKDEADKQILSQMRMNGIVIDDPTVIAALDNQFIKKSSVIPVTKKTNGELAKSSKTMNSDALQLVRAYTNQKVADLGKAIVKGEINPEPFKEKDRTACDYCNYKSVCKFDKQLDGFDYREIKGASDEDVLNKIKEELHPKP